MLTLGIDSGTQSTKTIVLDFETGEILASAQAAYGFIEGLPPGHLEQHPQTWLDAAALTVAKCLLQIGGRREEVAAMGVSGQQHGMVALNSQDKPVRPAKLWCDTSTTDQCAQFEARFGGKKGLIDLAGNAILPGYTAPKILWLKQKEPASYRATDCFLLPHDYLNLWLTGEKRMEYGDASGTGLLDIRTREWSRPLVDFIDPDLADLLPKPRTSQKAIGLLRETLRKEWGLAKSPIISAGGGDNMMAAIGTGNIAPGIVTASLGTSGTLFSFAEAPVIDGKGEVAAFCDSTDRWLPLVCTMNVTIVTEQVRRLFGWDLPALEKALLSAPAGCDGLLFLPYLQGERTPDLPNASGVYHGLNTANMQPAHMARAAAEGATLGLAYGLNRFRELGIQPAEIRLTGGGSNSAAWRQIAADVFGVPTVCLSSHEGAALGAAIQAGWSYLSANGNSVPLHEITARLVRLEESTRSQPNAENVRLYPSLSEKHAGLTKALNDAGYL